MAYIGKRCTSSSGLMIRIVIGCILILSIAGVAGAAAGQDLYFSNTTLSPSFVTCGQGCQCLYEFEIPTVFGESGRNYVKCSETPCGQGTVVEVRQYKYCFRPQQTPPAQQPPVQQPQAPAPGASTGSLSVSSIPSGASVTLDGQYRGNTPVTIPNLPSGYHDLRLSLSGYQDSIQSPSVSVGTTTALSISLAPSGQGVSQVSAGEPQVGVEVLRDDQVSVISLADDRDKLNPQPEPPSPADRIKLNPQPEPPKPVDYNKLNPQPEPPRPVTKNFFDAILGFFTGLFGMQQQEMPSVPVQDKSKAPSSMQFMSVCNNPEMTTCNGECVNTQTDPDHCGLCETKCSPQQVCSSGHCRNICDFGLANCDRHCVDNQTDNTNCGFCSPCSEGTSCMAGKCLSVQSTGCQSAKDCSSGYLCQNGVCVREYITAKADKVTLNWGEPVTFSGEDFTRKQFVCIKLYGPGIFSNRLTTGYIIARSDVIHTGTPSPNEVTGIPWKYVWDTSKPLRSYITDELFTKNIGSYEVKVFQDDCESLHYLSIPLEFTNAVASECSPACNSPETCCLRDITNGGNFCAMLATDNESCGTCGHHCQPTERCVEEQCVTIACPPGLSLCNGVCSNMLTDKFNCGSCGKVCKSGCHCAEGGCVSDSFAPSQKTMKGEFDYCETP